MKIFKTLMPLYTVVAILMGGCGGTDWEVQLQNVDRSSPALVSFDSCQDLETRLKGNLHNEMVATLLNTYDSFGHSSCGPFAMCIANDNDATKEFDHTGIREEGDDYSGTNNQEDGVDEPDIVKTDGNYIYSIANGNFYVSDVREFGQLAKAGHLPIAGEADSLLLAKQDGETIAAIVFSKLNYCEQDGDLPHCSKVKKYTGYNINSKATIIKFTKHENENIPFVANEYFFEGRINTARMVDNVVQLVVYSRHDIIGMQKEPTVSKRISKADRHSSTYDRLFYDGVSKAVAKNDEIIDEIELADFFPNSYYRGKDGKLSAIDYTEKQCKNFLIPEDGVSYSVNTIYTIDLSAPDKVMAPLSIVSGESIVYSSKDKMVLAEPSQERWWYYEHGEEDESTNIHLFDIAQGTKYLASARIAGTVHDQFGLSEADGVIRAVSTTDMFDIWMRNSNVYTLGYRDDKLQILGHIGGIAPGEDLYAARFTGNRGYLVTFRQTDPLWTVDLSNPENPKLVQGLKIPGASTYLHPLDGDSLMLTIGYGGTTEGLSGNYQVSLFDVSDLAATRMISSQLLGPKWSGDGWNMSSPAISNHHAFQYWGPMKMLAVPLSLTKTDEDYHYQQKELLSLMRIESEGQLSTVGEVEAVDHDYTIDRHKYYNRGDWEILRSIFMGQYIYIIRGNGISCAKIDDLSITASIEY